MYIPTTQLTQGAGGDFTLIHSETLGGDAATIDVTDIPQGYTHLVVKLLLRVSDANNPVLVRFNNDSGANYDWINELVILSNFATTEGVASTSLVANYCARSTDPANEFAMIEYQIPFYTGEQLKKLIHSGHVRLGTTSALFYYIAGGGTWRSTSAINRITLLTVTNYLAVSSIMVYGLN